MRHTHFFLVLGVPAFQLCLACTSLQWATKMALAFLDPVLKTLGAAPTDVNRGLLVAGGLLLAQVARLLMFMPLPKVRGQR